MQQKPKSWHRLGGLARAKKLSGARRRQIASMGGKAGGRKRKRCGVCHRLGHNARTCPEA